MEPFFSRESCCRGYGEYFAGKKNVEFPEFICAQDEVLIHKEFMAILIACKLWCKWSKQWCVTLTHNGGLWQHWCDAGHYHQNQSIPSHNEVCSHFEFLQGRLDFTIFCHVNMCLTLDTPCHALPLPFIWLLPWGIYQLARSAPLEEFYVDQKLFSFDFLISPHCFPLVWFQMSLAILSALLGQIA